MGQHGKGYRTGDDGIMAVAPEAPMIGMNSNRELTVEHEAPTVHVEAPHAKKSAEPCALCGSEQSAIRINVDGNTLLMESCDTCDVRRWQLEGERIDLQEALNQVGEHSGRKRPRA